MKKILTCVVTAWAVVFATSPFPGLPAAHAASQGEQQGYVRQAGGNSRQISTLDYSRGGRMYHFDIRPGATQFIPKDARNVLINGRPATAGQKAVVSPRGEIQWQ